LRVNFDLIEIAEDRCGFDSLLFTVDKNPHIISFFLPNTKGREKRP
jgi:hypothetical protein